MTEETSTTTCASAVDDMVYAARDFGVHLTPVQQRAFIRYCGMLQAVNAHTNLTALRSPEAMAQGLFLDSLALIPVLPPPARSEGDAVVRLVDVGSGAGIPGLPLAVACPALRTTLIESTGKKAQFLRLVSETLGLSRVSVVADRAETAARSTELRDAADVCVARAVAPLSTLVELCAPFVRPGGVLLFPKSGDIAAECRAAQPARQALGLSPETVLVAPSSYGPVRDRVIVQYVKCRATPDRYPRRIGLARSRPIGS